MGDLTPENAMFVLHGMYLPTMKNESRVTAAILAAVPAEKCEYRPDPVAMSAIELVRHIANADNFFVEAVLDGAFRPAARVSESAKTPAEIARWYEEYYGKNFAALSKATSDQLTKVIDFRGRFQWPGVQFLMIGLHHTIHHRGQLSSYLRSMGAKVPAIYGESYDSARAKNAAQG